MRSRSLIWLLVATLALAAGTAAAERRVPAAGKPAIDRAAVTAADLDGLDAEGGLGLDDQGGAVVVTRVDAGAWQKLGVRVGDTIVAIDGVALRWGSEVRQRGTQARSQAVIYVEIVRKKKPVLLRRVVADAPGAAEDAAFDAMFRRVDEVTYEVDFDAVLLDPTVFGKGARVLPAIKDGKPDGFKLYAIRPSSGWARLGLQNGDTVLRLNGFELTSYDQALELYTKLRTADRIVAELRRRGKPLTITYLRRATPKASPVAPVPKP